MSIYCTGIARIKHSRTGEIFQIECDELDWDAVGGSERDMGPETYYEAIVDHPELGELKWELWEYPIGCENLKQEDIGQHELLENFRYGLTYDDDSEPDYWIDYPIPENPFSIFMDSYHHTGILLADHGGANGGYLFNRMVFAHHVTALEAYLSDTLINAVMGDQTTMRRLIEHDNELKETSVKLLDIANDPDLVNKKVREYLQKVLYHNLAKVRALYRIALRIDLFACTSDKEELFKIVDLRHDCVHRNGLEKDGKKHEVFTKDYVQSSANLIKDFVKKINEEVSAKTS